MTNPSTPGAGDREGGEPSAGSPLRGAPRRKSNRKRGKCQHCGKILMLDAQGRFRLHQITWTRPKGSDCHIVRSIGPCPGFLEQYEDDPKAARRDAPEASSPKGPLPATPEVTP